MSTETPASPAADDVATDTRALDDAAADEAPQGFAGFVRAATSWRELRATPYGMAPALVISAIGFLQVFDSTAWQIAGPDIVRAYDIDLFGLLRIQQFIGFFAIFAGLWLGWFADRARRVPLYVGAAIGSGLASMATAAGSTALSLGIPRTIDEVSERAGNVPEGSLMADYYPFEARGRAYAMNGTLQALARVLALPIGGAAVTWLGVRFSFIAFGAPLVLAGIVAAFLLREPVRGYFERRAYGQDEVAAQHEDEPRSFGEGWRTTWSVRTVQRMFGGFVILNIGVQGFFLLYPFFLAERYGLNAFERGLLGIPAAIAAIVGGLVGGGMVDVFTRRAPGRVFTVFGVFIGLSALALVATAFEPPLVVLVIPIAVFYFGATMIGPAFSSVISQVIPPDVRTLGLQIFGMAQLPALLFGVPLFSALLANYGYSTAFLTAAPIMAVGALAMGAAAPFFDLDRRSSFAATAAAEEWRRTREAGEGKLLVCRGVDVDYDGVQVLFGVDFDVEDGEIIALLGTNGAGKSTLLRAISGTQEASGGAIVFDGRDITHMPPHEIAQRQVIHMPGGRGVFPDLSVRENLLLGGWMIDDDAELKRRLEEVHALFPSLRGRATTAAGALSGGEQQQLAMAQALLADPRLLMIDELSLGLAPAVVTELLEKVREIHARGTTIIIVEQSVNVALTIADRAIFMEKGEVKFVGPTADLLRRPDILRAVYVKGTGGLDRPTRAVSTTAAGDAGAVALSVQGITKRYGGVTALDGVSFDLTEGSVLGIIGPNGSGKTTMFDVISGFQRADAGRVVFEGRDITADSPEERARARLVRRFQDARLFPSLTVYEAILVALDRELDVRSSLLNAGALPRARRAERRLRERADRLIGLLELGTYRDKFVKELSTGVRRVVDLACVLAAGPRLLLLDEPSAGIAQAEAEGLAPLLRRVRHETGCSILIIEHDMPLLSRVADELLALDNGVVVTRGAPDEVLSDDRVIEAYLGTSEDAVRRSGGLDT